MKMSPSSQNRSQKSCGGQASKASSKRTLAGTAPSLAARFPKATLVPVQDSEDLSDYSDFDDDVSDTTDLTVDDYRTRDSCTPATPRTTRTPLTPPTTGRSDEKFKPSSPSITSRATVKTHVSSTRNSNKLPASKERESKGPVTNFGKNLEFIIPYEISARLSEDQTKCIATVVKSEDGSRCSYNAKGSPCGYPIEPRLQALRKACSERNYTTLVDCIKEFSSIAMCGNHYKVKESTRMKKLKESVRTLQAGNALSKEAKKDFHAWLKQLSNATYNTSTSTVDGSSRKRHDNGSGSIFPLTDSAAPVVSGEKGTLHQDNTKLPTAATCMQFRPYQPKWMKDISISKAIRKVIGSELTKEDHKRGFIYMFGHVGQDGYIKIGRSDDIVRRLRESKKSCGRKYEFCKPSLEGELDDVSHVNRIEKLMQAELKDLRRATYCERCKRCHGEWFEVEELHAVAVFTKWKEWIKTRPYEPCADGKWRLSESARKGLNKICEPVVFPGKVANEPKKMNGRHRRASL